MVDSVLKNPGCNIEIILYLNDDDPLLDQYINNIKNATIIVGPDQSTSYSWNLMAKKASYDILFLIGDDTMVETDNWGPLIIREFDKVPDKILMVAPKAGSLGKTKCPHFFLHKNWVNALGYYLPPHFYHHYVDHWIRDIAVSLRRYVHLENFVMPIIKNVNDEVINRYNRSWLKEKDTWLWEVTGRYKEADILALQEYIRRFR
jgi:hypothetical protein